MSQKIFAGVLLFCVASTSCWAQSLGHVETSEWNTYRSIKFGFEVKHPKSLHERGVTGTANGQPIERVDFTTTPEVGKPQEGLVFYVQRNTNPKGLSIDQWYADQMKKAPKAPSPKTLIIGGRPAAWYKVAGAFGQNYSFFVSLNKTDILTIAFTRPLSEAKLDQTFETILSTIKFLD